MSWVTTRISKMDHINAAQKKHQSVSKEIWLALFRREVLSWVTTRISRRGEKEGGGLRPVRGHWSLWGEKLQRITDSEVRNKSDVNLLCWKFFS